MLNKLQLQILPELQLQNLDQPLCSKSEQKFSFLTKPQFRNLQQIVADTILISNSYSDSYSYNINKFWVDIFTRQGHNNQVYLLNGSQWVSEWVTSIANDRTHQHCCAELVVWSFFPMFPLRMKHPALPLLVSGLNEIAVVIEFPHIMWLTR